jgi:hypothetical protein
MSRFANHLFISTAVDDGRLELVLGSSRGGSVLLELFDNPHVLLLDLTKDDVLAIEPRSDDSGDEELRAVAAGKGEVSKGQVV